ncbi:outer membrane lipid asymmetry maintenance protein MlaD [Shimia thalassica]|jgi:phospholipid/cholesterol/gamma-HCH transport system substrate-binding protein|uniref:Putative phospholipid ABC transporter-binding protein MlaD n=1 Tax=Shimia thalassica TaxID=1715693 RepID=A0A0P1IF47_9RHOB|nr:outer membrane lipid asymmetry maintenance protein MlaD [Shimia thalassica]PHO03248.1 outer membrane lipid asymmetry maintenance protein MlaD [Rhodobacteraceae bacterium 4F10]MBU2944553.1 outer membrane lipid asymmetry maintenance protein MlaD [Shimia thalassica]MDO6479603.1 outer membrane lipid asymmetry maintenance protein MlaD [Shimia thalassica]MDO6482479.1 outer membrane lipid asymmetry maintenance protein MlaD [Shimia thalassica]MDO6502101.1 outer membrane lipid asymmetry maintenance 
MSAVKTEVAVGAGVVAIAVGFLIYAGQVTGLSASTAGYPLTASFRSLEGVSVGTDVRLAGVKIGSVTGISLNPQTFRADTEFTVLSGIELPDDSAIVVSSEGLLGGNFVEILPGGSPFNLEAGAEIEDTQSSVSLVGLLMKFVAGGDSE